MFGLTNQERLVLLVLSFVMLTGTLAHWVFQKVPRLQSLASVIDSETIYPKTDINLADEEDLVSIPYIGPYTARRIIDYREEHGPFVDIEQLKTLQGIKEKNFKKFAPFIKIGKR